MALPHSTNIFDYPARFQFGQAGAPCGGKSCCTDTCIQMIVEYYKEVHYSLSEIRRRAQASTSFNEDPCTGINHIEVVNALKSFDLGNYRAAFGVDASDVWNYVQYGPVLVGVHYGSYPNWNNRCTNPHAEVAGRTDCTFKGSHAILAIGRRYHTIGGTTHKDFFMRDPDHNSAARPEKPAFDRITIGQLDKAMKNIVPYTDFNNTYIVYTTKKKTL